MQVNGSTYVNGRDADAGQETEQPQKSDKTRDLRPLLALRPYVLKNPLILIGAGVALLVAAAMMLVIPMAVRRMIDHGFVAGSADFIAQYFVMLIVIGGVLAIASASRFYLVNWLGERVVADLRSDVFRHLTTLGPAYFDHAHSGEVMSRLTADTTQMKSAASIAISQAVRSAIMVVGALIMMFITSVQLALLVLVAIPIVLVPLIGYGRVVRRLSRTAQDSLADASAYAAENLAAVRTMQAFSSERQIADKFADSSETAFGAARARLFSRAALTAIAMFLVVTSIVLVLWMGATMVIEGTLTGGRLSQFVLYAVLVGGALGQLSEVWGEVQQAAGAAERLSELLAERPAVMESLLPIKMADPARGHIKFDKVTFTYPARPDTMSLNEVSFRVEPGQKVALVGPSGAGKTTLFNLLLRFYDPDSGTVSIDGADISKVRLHDLRRRIALVPQDIVVFADTVSENIRYGYEDCGPEDIERAAKIAQADGFISELPKGYATELGERGVTLSGGQRQRLAIARAVLRDPAILLLDEATSALEDVMEGRTTLIITHRLTTAQKADRIIVLDDGEIVEQGDHKELNDEGGLYQRFSELQLG